MMVRCHLVIPEEKSSRPDAVAQGLPTPALDARCGKSAKELFWQSFDHERELPLIRKP